MGVAWSALSRLFFGKATDYKIVLVGLNNAGKTTILYRLNLGDAIVTQPTIGCNVEEISFRGVKFTCWDLGGQEALRDLWPSYFKSDNFADAIIFVVDSNDVDSFVTAKMELMNILILANVRQTCKAVLVLANKQDVTGAKSASDLVQALSLHEIRTHDWQIMPCCALTGEGLNEGMEWIVDKLKAVEGESGNAGGTAGSSSGAGGAASGGSG